MFLNSSNSSGWNICECLWAGAVSLSVCISRRLWLTFPFDRFCVFLCFFSLSLKPTRTRTHARTDAEKQTAERSGQCYFVFWQTDKKREKRDLHRPVIRPVWQRREQRGWKISTRGELGEKEGGGGETAKAENGVWMIWITMCAVCLGGPPITCRPEPSRCDRLAFVTTLSCLYTCKVELG